MPKRKGRKYLAQKNQGGNSEPLPNATSTYTLSSGSKKLEKRFPRTVCVNPLETYPNRRDMRPVFMVAMTGSGYAH
jgi:hypothetical protein